MLLEYKIDNQIKKINNNNISKNIIPNIYKCKFYFNKDLWDGQDIFINITNGEDQSVNIYLGTYLSVISYIIPEYLVKGEYVKLYAFTKNFDLKTNTITVLFNKAYDTLPPRCHNNLLLGIMQQLEQKYDDVIVRDNYLQFYSNGKLVDAFFLEDLQINKTMTEEINNLQEQIDYLKTKNYGEIKIIDTLPEEGEKGILYYLYNDEDSTITQYYYDNNGFHQIPGSRSLNLSDYVKKEDVDLELSEQGDMILKI